MSLAMYSHSQAQQTHDQGQHDDCPNLTQAPDTSPRLRADCDAVASPPHATPDTVMNGFSNPDIANMPQLPPLHEFSIDGILDAIQPDIQGTIDAIAEILGRSSFSLANQYGSHRPPQGVIRAGPRGQPEQNLLPVEEASSSNERLADAVVIVGEDTSLIDGSHGGSVAFDLLDRIRAANNARRQRESTQRQNNAGNQLHPSPELTERTRGNSSSQNTIRQSRQTSLALLQGSATRRGSRITSQTLSPMTSPTQLAVGTTTGTTFIREGGHSFPLYEVAEARPFEDPPIFNSRMDGDAGSRPYGLENHPMMSDLQHHVNLWLQHSSPIQPLNSTSSSAHNSLQRILNQMPEPARTVVTPENDLYSGE